MTRASQNVYLSATPGAVLRARASMVWVDLPTRRFLVRRGLALALIFAGLAALHVHLRLQVTHLRYNIGAAEALRKRLEAEKAELIATLAHFERVENIETLARERLGLRVPEKGQEAYLP